MNITDILGRLKAVVGPEYVLSSPGEIETYSKCTIPWDKTCAGVVLPATTEEVQAIVHLANELHFPLWVFSRGKNWGYGTTCVMQQGAIVLLLERMNQIFEVNSELAYAVIGAGVSYSELNTYLKTKKLKLWADCTDSTPQGSVIGNALDRGRGYSDYGDHFGNLCGMEVVLPDGRIIRTGGGPANSRSFHTYKYGVGPYVEGLFSQSNMGIVVKSGVWLMPEPEEFNFFTCEIDEDAACSEAIDSIRRLTMSKVITSNVHMVNSFMAMSVSIPYPYDRLEGGPCLSASQLEKLRKEMSLSSWTLSGGIYGFRDQVRLSRERIKKEFGRYGKVTFLDDARIRACAKILSWIAQTKKNVLLNRGLIFLKNKLISPAPTELMQFVLKFYPIFKGIPSQSGLPLAYMKSGKTPSSGDLNPVRDNCGLMWLAPVSPLGGKDVQHFLDMAKPLFEQYGFDFGMTMGFLNPRSIFLLVAILYDKKNAEEMRRATALYDALSEKSLLEGYPQYRTSLAYMERLLSHSQDFGDMLDRIKAALDPNDVLSPGRYGVGRQGVRGDARS